MSCSITSQWMIKDKKICLGQLLAELWTNLYILAHMPYTLRSSKHKCYMRLDKVVKFSVFLSHLWWRWSNLSGCFMAGRFVAERYVEGTFRFRTFLGLTSP